MDSLTQFVLGAAVSTACLGPKIGARKAAVLGGLLGTLPDLDVFLPFDDPVDSFVYHRGWTHSVFVHALAAPVIGEGLMRLFKGLRDQRWLTYGAVYLVLATHAMIDAMTVYGTRIFWPFYPDPVGVGSVFIIDPLYTLPLLCAVIWALCTKTFSARLKKVLTVALVFSTSYMGASVLVQRYVEGQARSYFAEAGSDPDKVFAIAAPFNILVWKVIGLEDDSYRNFYYSLLGGNEPPEIYAHARNPELVTCLRETPAYRKLDWFSRGYNRVELIDGKIVLSDLRMGLTPGYAFRFVIGETDEFGIKPVPPQRDLSLRRADPEDLAWLGDRLLGIASVRAAEAQTGSSEGLSGGLACSLSARTAPQ
ncbi:inner membrane protein [Roseibium hamelinense]|uniref:Inner membrane protein n=1 Tax=Roseibium hamelinense TaxID=150831 RepID=A0A562T8D6_9HYPH|nr:metal-dependent hydrolase [Roseibium hamelinense]MTI42803.1 metal-dependent hydrolase [Roseibium hamelinense]TWI89468.1 inner membrane protein [Roseibium hamelinense]